MIPPEEKHSKLPSHALCIMIAKSVFWMNRPLPLTQTQNTKFHELIQGKTAVLITHRLSAVQLADVVAVFDNGKLSEYGTHRELYEQGGKYKEMYDKQAAFYVKSDTSAAAE